MISPGKLGRLPSLRPGTASGFKQRAVALHPAGWSGDRHLCGAGALWGPRPEIQGGSYISSTKWGYNRQKWWFKGDDYMYIWCQWGFNHFFIGC
jgi:hypothetical protein